MKNRMKTIRKTSTKEGYLYDYVRIALSAYDINTSTRKVLTQILYKINEDILAGIPYDAAAKLAATKEYRDDMAKAIGISNNSLANALMSLRKVKILNSDNILEKKILILYSDGGFCFEMNIGKDGK